ncbi:DUF5663 domain-containing protein [Mycolicibacterium peregrinum]|uniref:DUF5663 domain-containing protein n=1 Tax=Mycolicibacterium peregrinum TaxID=43304 RepID=UPI0010427AA2|nr:DUF5663 domain-containing protein [Mycolicibacterium peregrinum]
MTLTITRDVIADLGYTRLTEEQASQLLDQLVATLTNIVGYRIARATAGDAADSLAGLPEDDVLAWLQTQAPGHEEVVRHVFEEIRQKLKQLSDAGASYSD